MPKALKRYLHSLYEIFIKPHSFSVDTKRQEFILNILLLASIVLLLWGEAQILVTSTLQGSAYKGMPIFLFSIILICFIVAFLLSRNGYIRTASYLLIGFYFLGATYGAYSWGPDLQPVIISYILIIFISGILISGKFGFIMTAVISLTILALAGAQITGAIHPATYWKYNLISLRDMVEFVIMFFIITTISWLSNRELEKALHRARESEESLKEERDLLELKVERRTEELRQTQAEKISQLYHFAEFGKMSSSLFHDLINPLFVISSSIENLNQNFHPELPYIKDHLELSLKASRKLKHLITAVKRQIQMEDFKEMFTVNNIVEDVITLFQHKAALERIDLIFEADEKIYLYQNPLKFQQIVSNLISNAIDSYEGITGPEKAITVSLSLENEMVTLSVKDSGRGISEETMPKIFEPFFTTKSSTKGMGLGLSSVKQIVEKNFSGTIKVESSPGKGSKFSITFPAKNEKSNQSSSKLPSGH